MLCVLRVARPAVRPRNTAATVHVLKFTQSTSNMAAATTPRKWPEIVQHVHPVIRSVSELPVVAGAYYGLDLDDTLLKQVFVTKDRDATTYYTSRYTTEFLAQHPPDVEFVNHLHTIATVHYVTFRDESMAAETHKQLANLGFPPCPVHFSCNKGYTITLELEKARDVGPAAPESRGGSGQWNGRPWVVSDTRAPTGSGQTPFTEVIFADDLSLNVNTVKSYIPHAKCFLVQGIQN